MLNDFFFSILKSVKPLRAAKQQAIIDRLRNQGQIAALFINSLEAKASVINIPVIVGDKIFKDKSV